jgi:hypothetical protein
MLALVMASCSTKTTAPVATPIPPPNMEIQTFGLLKFGSVVVGDYRQTQVTVKNNTADFAPFTPIVSYPFSISDVSTICATGKIPAGVTCSFNLNFKPNSNGNFSTKLDFGTSSVSFTGKGLQGGDISVSEYNINLGKIKAGSEVLKSLTLTNTGDFTVNFPSFVMGSEYKILSNYCGAALDPKQACSINFQVLKTSLGTQTDSITMTSTSRGSGTTTVSLAFSSLVIPGNPNGNIAFDGSLPAFVVGGDKTTLITSGLIKDIFGNNVIDGTPVTVSLTNLNLAESSNVFLTNNGRVTFHVSTKTTKGSATVTLFAGDAFGFIPIYVAAGPAYGSITLQPYFPNLIANGINQLILRTNTILDKFGNIIEDGSQVFLSSIDGGNISTNGIVYAPALSATSFNGLVQFTLRAGTSTGNEIIKTRGTTSLSYDPNDITNISFDQSMPSKTGRSFYIDNGTSIHINTNATFLVYQNNILFSSTQLDSTQNSGNYDLFVYFPLGDPNVITTKILGSNYAGVPFNEKIIVSAAIGESPISYIPGPAQGNIPIVSGKDGMNAVGDFTLVSIGPVRDATQNVVVQGTPISISIQNGVNLSGTGRVLNTDASGIVSFQLAGSGNRGPILITASTTNAKGTKSVWAYKDSHLTLQGQKRDDWGNGAGNDGINSGRLAVRYYKATSDPTLFPPANDVWDEIFDYTQVSSNDRIYYDIERFNGNPISTSGPVTVPSSSNITSKFITFTGPDPEPMPLYNSPVWYAAGNKVMAAPFWAATVPPAGTRLQLCGNTSPDSFGNYLYNLMMYTISSGLFGCNYNGSVVTTNSDSDRLESDLKSNLFYPSIGYAEDPVACSFDSGQSPIFNFNLGTFVVGSDTTRQIQISNPNPTDLTNFSILFTNGTDPNWTISNVDCGTTLASQATCSINVKFNNTSATSPAQYSSSMSVNSNAVSSNVLLSVTLIGTGTPPPFTGVLGLVTMKTNCYSKVVDFGGYNYQWRDENHNATIAVNSKLTSTFNGRGQVISRVDNNCESFQTQVACAAGNSCVWAQPEGSDPATADFFCSNVTDLGSYPSKGKGFSPFVAVGKSFYNFSGFDPTGDGQPSVDGLSIINSETGIWSGVSVDSDDSIPISPTFLGYPASRYEHGMVYVPETTSLYIYGGVGISNAPGSMGAAIYFNDLWQLNINPAPIVDQDGTSSIPSLKWKRICDNCVPVDPSVLFTKISRDPLQQGPGFTNNPGVSNLIWNKARKQVLMYWESRPYVYSFDPTANHIVITALDSGSGANFLGSAFQVLYNARQERMYAYFQGNPSSNILPSLKMWDMDINEKVYTKTRFQLGAGSKQWATIISPRIKAFGSAGADPSCGDPCPGVSAYIYNYDTSAWDLIGDNTAITDIALNSQGEITNSWINGEAQKHISVDGFVDILVMPKGSPLHYNQVHIDSIYLDGTF